MSKTNKLRARKKIALELLHHILGHRSTRSLLAGDTDNVWEDIELRIDPDPFFHIMSYFFHEQKGKVGESTESKSSLQVGVHAHHAINITKSFTSDTTLL